jgi:hypothetical protein
VSHAVPTTTVSADTETTKSDTLANTISALFTGDENPIVRFINYFAKKFAEFLAEMKVALEGYGLGFLRGLFSSEK